MLIKIQTRMGYVFTIGLLLTVQLAQADDWYRGNTHTHTVICGHADSPPEVVAAWYHDHGYNFLILSEHNHFIDPQTVKMPENKRGDFILIPGEEVTGSKRIHSTAMNVNGLVPWKFNHESKSAIIQNHVDGTIEGGGQAILNHPNFQYAVSAKDILPVHGLYMFELFNGHPHVHNAGDKAHPSTEELWDQLLTKGMLMYGVSSDDAHHFQTMAKTKSNPGRGWVMVQAPALDPDAITKAMLQGNFYASNGVFLKTCKKGPDAYVVEVDVERTEEELTSSPKLRGMHVGQGTPGYRIEFIGPDGHRLKTMEATSGRYDVDPSTAYVRAKVTLTRKHPETNQLEEYYAWGQPVFTDERASTLGATPGDEKWQSLFDGKTLAGWEAKNGQPVTKNWIVEEGCLFRKEKGGNIFTVGEYEDCELELEWKISPGGNSGVKYRFKDGLGPEYQVLDDQDNKSGKSPLHNAAALYALFPCNDQKALKPVGEFNKARIIAKGTKLEHWLNGKKVLEADTSSPEWVAAKAASKFEGKGGFGEGAGKIMLQDHGNPAWFRSIRIRVLK